MQELCKNGGILSLALTILRLRVPKCFQDSAEIIASVSRFKAKILALVSTKTVLHKNLKKHGERRK
jgi:hypothetical protein